MDFAGTKLLLFVGGRVLVVLRDDRADIPWPGYWDFPGGAREGFETPQACILRETREEVALRLAPSDLIHVDVHERPMGAVWLFAAHLPLAAEAGIVLGDEGQCWQLMARQQYIDHPRTIPHFAGWLRDYL